MTSNNENKNSNDISNIAKKAASELIDYALSNKQQNDKKPPETKKERKMTFKEANALVFFMISILATGFYFNYKYDHSEAGKLEYQAHLERQKEIKKMEKGNEGYVAASMGFKLVTTIIGEILE